MPEEQNLYDAYKVKHKLIALLKKFYLLRFISGCKLHKHYCDKIKTALIKSP